MDSNAEHSTDARVPQVAKHPLWELLSLALPTIAQMASYTLMQFVDTWILAHAGHGIYQPTAAANSGMIAFAVLALGMGSLFLVNTLVSQSFGRQDDRACGQYLWQGVWFSVLFSLVTVPILFLAGPIFKSMGHEPELARLEAVYLQITVSMTLVKLVGTSIGQFLLAINRPSSVLAAAVCGVSVNAVAAGYLVMGILGGPRLGVAGAAWAQNIGVSVEMLVLVVLVSRRAVRRRFNVTDWRPRVRQMWTLLRLGLPSGFQTQTEVLAWSVWQMGIMGLFGTAAMAANTYVLRYMAVSFMPAFGISQAITALVGRYIGMGRTDLARRRADLGFAVAAVYMVVCGIGLYLGRVPLMDLFSDSPEVIHTGTVLLCIAAVYQLFDAMYISYSGALRGAGDTLLPALATTLLCWSITVAGGFAAAHYRPRLGPIGPWIAASVYGIILGLFMLLRFKLGRWMDIHLANGDAANRHRAGSKSVDSSAKVAVFGQR